MMKQGDETRGEMSSETCNGKNEKRPWLMCCICGTSQIITLAPVELLHFSEEKQCPRRHRPR
jgi:hypothetical protein